ncbi:hypothetical protein Barb4_00867 [Bacteroidales bacterium Barb4]|nr:hypothetical protein Barb4_00867 [Bacteroidales bacterium Barb4]
MRYDIVIKKNFCSFITIFFMLIFPTGIKGQDKERITDNIHAYLGYNHVFGVSAYTEGGFYFNFAGIYDVNRRLSAGAGINAEKIKFRHSAFPVYGTVRYSPLNNHLEPYVFANIGYAVGSDISNPGILFIPGIGYKVMLRKHFEFNFTLNYSLRGYNYSKKTDGFKSNEYDHSIGLGAGFIF